MSGFQLLSNLIFIFFVFQKKAWHTIKTMVNLPVISPFKKRYSWVQLAGHTGKMDLQCVCLWSRDGSARKTVFQYFSISFLLVKRKQATSCNPVKL